MSFASEVREELCRELPEKKCCRLAECYGILLYCNTFSKQEIRIVTASDALAQRLPRLFRRAFDTAFDRLPPEGAGGKRTFLITDPDKIRTVRAAYGQESAVSHHINYGVLESDCCRQSFLRGAFLAGGSVTDPDKRYHLELITSHRKVSAGTRSLLQELGFEPKDAQRTGSSVLYLKQSDMIVDFLTMIGAPLQAMKIIQAKMEKSVRNRVNRRVNCETANLDKAVDAAQGQLSAIRSLRESGRLDSLPPKLLEAARLREENPEATLSELAALADPPVSKPAMSHRLRSVMERSKEE